MEKGDKIMENLKRAIIEKGTLIGDSIVKVDSFLNHQIDPQLTNEMGKCFYEHFKDKGITKIVTIESSGIAPSFVASLYFNVPMVFIKKTHPSTMENPITATVHSFTKNKTYTVCMDKGYLNENDKVLFIDDFLANGEAFKGAEEIIKQTEAEIVGVGIVIEKEFQQGHAYIIKQGYDLYSLASIISMKDGHVIFK